MLLFQPEHITMVQKGFKTETRRLWKKCRVKVGSTQQVKRAIYTKEHFGLIRIKYVCRQNLRDISEVEARREGGYTREEYLKLWKRINPNSPENPLLYVVGFEYIGYTHSGG